MVRAFYFLKGTYASDWTSVDNLRVINILLTYLRVLYIRYKVCVRIFVVVLRRMELDELLDRVRFGVFMSSNARHSNPAKLLSRNGLAIRVRRYLCRRDKGSG